MAQTIKLKRSSTAGNVPSTADLSLGEIAINTADGAVYIKKNDGSDSIVAIHDDDVLKIDTGNSRIGIGTSSPSEKLSVAPDTDNSAEIGRAHIGSVGHSDYAAFSHVDRNTTGNYALMQHGSGVTYLNAASGTGINFRISNTQVMKMTSSGLGIGTTSPSRKLHVSGSGATVGIKVEATDGSQASLDLTNTEGAVRLINDGGAFQIYDDTDTAQRLHISTAGAVTFNSAYTFPTADGSANQVLQTDGSGNLSFADVSSGGGVTISHLYYPPQRNPLEDILLYASRLWF
jgi:hypothetical protein